MYAECPHCHAIFRVTQQILEKANGKVRCGQCKKVFAAVTKTPSVEADSALRKNHGKDNPGPDTSFSEHPVTRPGEPSHNSGRAKLKVPDVFPADLSEYLPVTYRGPRRKLRLRLPRISSTIVAFFLLFVFFAQYLNVHHQKLAAFPSLRPPLKILCAMTGCTIQPPRDLDKIKLLSHGVYSHPRIKNALLIKASMTNRAKFEQNYPIIQISLHNIKGHTIAMRRFGANEYLDGKQPHPEKMPIDKTIPIRIEVIDPGERALGFEFEFL